MDKILAIIPARGGSKGVPRKNIKILGGKPLIAHTIETALKANFNKLIVSTDDNEIAEIAASYGAEVPFLRPDYLSNDKAGSFGLIEHAVGFYEEKGEHFDAVCLLQPTYPFRTLALLESCIEKLNDNLYDSIVSVLEVPHEFNPYWVFEPAQDGSLEIAAKHSAEMITRRQELPVAYYRDGAVYITRTNIIKEKKSIYGDKIGFIVSDKSRYVNIDTMNDWSKAEILYSKLF